MLSVEGLQVSCTPPLCEASVRFPGALGGVMSLPHKVTLPLALAVPVELEAETEMGYVPSAVPVGLWTPSPKPKKLPATTLFVAPVRGEVHPLGNSVSKVKFDVGQVTLSRLTSVKPNVWES